MGLYLQFDEDGNQYSLASNQGWSDVGNWIETLPAAEFPQLHHLWNFGWSQDIQRLIGEIQAALDEEAPDDETVTTTVQNLQELLDDEDPEATVLVTDGLSPEKIGRTPKTFGLASTREKR